MDGDRLAVKPMPHLGLVDVARFLTSFSVGDDCWEWSGKKLLPTGYGRFNYGKSWFLAHRVAWRYWHGPVPKGLVVRHKCDHKPCVRPDHLELGTTQDNERDKVIRGKHYQAIKTHCPRGHVYDESNTYRNPTTGHRTCKACRAAWWATHTTLSSRRRSGNLREELIGASN